jgi:hypothetical protein
MIVVTFGLVITAGSEEVGSLCKSTYVDKEQLRNDWNSELLKLLTKQRQKSER